MFKHTAHVLVSSTYGQKSLKGTPAIPGRWVCSCGNVYPGINKFRKHQAENKRDTLLANPEWTSARKVV